MAEDPTPAGEPVASRPTTDERYAIPTDAEGLLPWSVVAERLTEDRRFWITTRLPNGRPHVRPTWGVWIEGAFHCGGGDRTRWVRNLALDPTIVVTREDAEAAVILEGYAERLDATTASPSLLAALDAAYERKYAVEHGPPFFAVRPERVYAWGDYPRDATRWTFEERSSPSGR